MTVESGQGTFRKSLPYTRKLILITEQDNPKNEYMRSIIKQALDKLLEPVEYKEVDCDKHPNMGKKLGAKMIKQYTRKNGEMVETESAVQTPTLVFLEDDRVVWQSSEVMRAERIWNALTRKPIYNQANKTVVPVNPYA